MPRTLIAPATNDTVEDAMPQVIEGDAVCYRRARVVAVQVGLPPGPNAAALAAQSLVDVRPVPVLVGAAG